MDRFRYLEKFVGTYRVMAPVCYDTGEFPTNDNGKGINPTFDDLYIPCSKGIIKHSYDDDILVWYCDSLNRGRKVKSKFEESKIKFTYEETDVEMIIYFDESFLDKVVKIVRPKTAGKKIKPYCKKNLSTSKNINSKTGKYEFPSKDVKAIQDVVKDLSRTDKLQFSKKCLKDFDKHILKIMGKDYNLEAERIATGLKPKEFIHSIGLWEEYVEFCKKELKKYNND